MDIIEEPAIQTLVSGVSSTPDFCLCLFTMKTLGFPSRLPDGIRSMLWLAGLLFWIHESGWAPHFARTDLGSCVGKQVAGNSSALFSERPLCNLWLS